MPLTRINTVICKTVSRGILALVLWFFIAVDETGAAFSESVFAFAEHSGYILPFFPVDIMSAEYSSDIS